ncbi:MAG: tryptophan-rich sensory protein [Clostridia bacterium]|nr:tryptophan-rich sensory protein [Clostridia bacterium]
MKNLITYVKAILIPLILGTVVGFITSGSMNFDMLVKPNFAPPAILFPIVWTILYSLMGVCYGSLKTKNLATNKINRIYYTQLIVNLLWSFIFFTFKLRLLAYLWILLLIILVIIMISRFYEKNKLSGLLQLPYLAWIVFASFLNLSIYLLNR